MTLARLLALTLLACSLPAFSQTQPAANPNQVADGSARISSAVAPKASDDSNVLELQPDGSSRAAKANAEAKVSFPNLSRPLYEDTTCYTIRSYVVARDSKHSDSTHPAGYSTCQPASRYGLKTTDIRIESVNR